MLKMLGLSSRQGLLMVVLSAIAAMANLAFQVISGRTLGPDQFSLLSVLLVGLSVAAVAASGLQVVSATSIAVSCGDERSQPAPARFGLDRLTMSAVLLFGLAGLLFASLSGVLAQLFDSSPTPFLWLAGFLPLAALFAITNGRLQGASRAAWVVTLGAVLSLAKLASSALVLTEGYGVAGVASAIWTTTAVIVLCAFFLTRQTAVVRISAWSRRTWHAVAVQVLYWIMLTLDVVLARVFMTQEAAGKFAVADMLAKSTLLLPSLVLIPLLPNVARHRSLGTSPMRLTIVATLATVVAMAVPVMILVVVGDPLITWLFGPEYILMPGLSGIIAVMTVFMGIAGVLLQFHLAGESWRYVVVLMTIVVVMVPLYGLTSDAPFQYALVYGFSGAATALALVPTARYRATWRWFRESVGALSS